MNYQGKQNFARIITLIINDGPVDCCVCRIGFTEIMFSFYLLNEEEDECVTPSITMDWPFKEVIDTVFDGTPRSEQLLKEKAIKAWNKMAEQLN